MERMERDSADKHLWYAVNGCGQRMVFTSYPVRDERRTFWIGEIDRLYYELVMQLEADGLIDMPAIAWKDEPVSIVVNLKIC